MKLVKIIVPVYRAKLPDLEEKLLLNNLSVLSNYPIVFVCPNSLDMSPMTALFDKNLNVSIERFDDHYFKGVDGYNKLMLSSEFYHRFLDSKYILICQTDAFVFRDDLTHWCNKGYDYIGGPWIGSPENKLLNAINGVLQKLKLMKKRYRGHLFKVGNGGFSLRKTDIAYKITEEYKVLIERLLNESPRTVFATEDMFWSFKAKELDPQFSIPEYKEALNFAIDRHPAIALKLNANSLPFGVHGFNKNDIYKFWIPYIKQQLK
ncbi:MAG: hypothetical protein LBU91_09330 [Bacteroidales bacterium]|jgi:hypothetical protein|nr:hypothetical protein [Bacteroidales bacterium]